MRYYTNLAPNRAEDTERPTPRLTARQLDILIRIARGMTELEIGAELYLTRDTVATHARRIYRALGARNRAHAVALAYRAGILLVPSVARHAAPATKRRWTA